MKRGIRVPGTNKEVVFYGAGSYAIQNIDEWRKKWNVVCFVDINKDKWGNTLGGVVIRPLDDVMTDYPDIDFIITTESHFNDIYSYLCEKGISAHKISFIVPREKRLGCKFLGKWFQLDGGKVIKTCCFERGYKQRIEEPFSESYELFIKNVAMINKKLEKHEPTTCDGCPMLVDDWWEISPKVECFSLATGFRGDICNCRCVYCDATGLLQSTWDNDNLSSLEVCNYFSSRADFDGIEIAINNGEFVINKYQKEILDICRKKKWHITLYSNATRTSDELLEYMKEHDTTVICSLDAGTRATFKKIKCVDGFEKAIDNLKKYSELGTVVLKYIVMKDCNCNMADVNGFIDIAKKVAKQVVLSRDLNMLEYELSEKERSIYRILIDELLYKASIPIEVSEDCIPAADIEWLHYLLKDSKS